MHNLIYMNEIRNYFENMVDLSDNDWNFFSSKLIKRVFDKNSIILLLNQKEDFLSFVEKGVVRKYVPKEFDDITIDFVFAGNFVTAYDSFLTRKPSSYQIESISDTIIWSISYNDLQEIYANTEIGNTIGRLASEDQYLKKSKRELAFLTKSAEERYLDLFVEQPILLKLLPLKYIASYIGITPQALSRIRKRIS